MPYAVPPLMLLPEIVDAVAARMKIFVDCGIESGADAFKCLAMGADAVSVGRAMMDPLHEQGAEGVVAKVAEMTGELVGFMARTGMSDLEHMDASVLYLRDF